MPVYDVGLQQMPSLGFVGNAILNDLALNQFEYEPFRKYLDKVIVLNWSGLNVLSV